MIPLPHPFDMTGRVAVVTGGAGLLGRQHARALVAIGANVVVADVCGEAAERAVRECGGDRLTALVMDVANPDSVHAGLDTLLAQFGRVHVLVNNAAIDPKVAPDGLNEPSRLENFDLLRWQFEVSVGLTGAFLCSQAFGTHMAASGGGVILNIASDLSVISPDQRLYRREGLLPEAQPVKPVTYSVIKAGLVGLTRYLSTYWAAEGVRANALSPGGVFNQQPEDFVLRLAQLIPVGRMASVDEYQAALQFLCSDASSYMTGQNIVMDGGRSVW